MSYIIPGAEPFFVRGGPMGVLLLHGFTASPTEMRPLADALRGEGYTLLGPRLPHHGTRPEDMLRAHWRDWYAAALDYYYLLREQCDKVFVAGLSMGGALALLVAAREPVAGLVLLSTPSLPFYEARGWRQRNAAWLGYIIHYLQKGPHRPPDAIHPVPRISYRVRPVAAVAQFDAVVREAALVMPQVRAPALIVHSRNDSLIPPDSAEYIHVHLGSSEKEMFWLERGDHVVTEDPAREQVFQQVKQFLRRHA